MSGFIEGENRYHSTLFAERIDDYVDEDSAARELRLAGSRIIYYPKKRGEPGAPARRNLNDRNPILPLSSR